MMILQINVNCVDAIPTESHAPIFTRPNGITAFVFTLEGVEPKAGQIYPSRLRGGMERFQKSGNPIRLLDT